MFKAFVIFMFITSGETDFRINSIHSFPTEEACQALLTRDVPTMQAKANELYPNTYLLKGECTEVDDDSL